MTQQTVACQPPLCSQAPLSWDFPGKNPGVGCHFLFQGISLTQRWNWRLLHCRWILYHGTTWEDYSRSAEAHNQKLGKGSVLLEGQEASDSTYSEISREGTETGKEPLEPRRQGQVSVSIAQSHVTMKSSLIHFTSSRIRITSMINREHIPRVLL